MRSCSHLPTLPAIVCLLITTAPLPALADIATITSSSQIQPSDLESLAPKKTCTGFSVVNWTWNFTAGTPSNWIWKYECQFTYSDNTQNNSKVQNVSGTALAGESEADVKADTDPLATPIANANCKRGMTDFNKMEAETSSVSGL
jgi:hypothetical protein